MYGGAEVDEHFDYWQIDALVADNNRYMAIRMESQKSSTYTSSQITLISGYVLRNHTLASST